MKSCVVFSLIFILLVTADISLGFRFKGLFSSAGREGAQIAGASMTHSASMLSQSLRDASNTLSQSFGKGVAEVKSTVEEMASSVSDLAQKVNLRIDSGEFANLGVEAAQNLRDALNELSNNWAVALNTADLKDFGSEASKHLSEALKNIKVIVDIGENALEAVEVLTRSIQNVTGQVTQSFDKGVDGVKDTVQQLTGTIEGLAKQVKVTVDSGDFAMAGDAATNNLKDALVELSKNWELRLNTKDLREIGAEAARHLGDAIQNINIKIDGFLEVGDNVRQSVLYISIAGSIAFSVLFIAIVVSIKQCRSCTVALFTVCLEGCRNCRGGSTENQNPRENIKPIPLRKMRESEFESKYVGKTTSNPYQSTIYEDVDFDDDHIYENLTTCKRNSASLNNYTGFNSLKRYWNSRTQH